MSIGKSVGMCRLAFFSGVSDISVILKFALAKPLPLLVSPIYPHNTSANQLAKNRIFLSYGNIK